MLLNFTLAADLLSMFVRKAAQCPRLPENTWAWIVMLNLVIVVNCFVDVNAQIAVRKGKIFINEKPADIFL